MFNPMTPNCPLAERSRASRGGRSGPAPTRAHPWPAPPAAPDPAWSRTQQWAASVDGVFHRAWDAPKSWRRVKAQSQKDGWAEEALSDGETKAQSRGAMPGIPRLHLCIREGAPPPTITQHVRGGGWDTRWEPLQPRGPRHTSQLLGLRQQRSTGR